MIVGDYVRTKYGISKILSNPENHNFNIDIFKKDRITLRCIRKKDVIKSSPNIIDLIEVGDYVNYHRVVDIETNIEDKNLYLYVDTLEYNEVVYQSDIKSIVTKEQFKSMEYKINV